MGMKQRVNAAASKLQRDLLPRIVDLVLADGLAVGDRVTELALTDRLQVSRTPVRAALAHLASLGVMCVRPTGGYELARVPEPGEDFGLAVDEAADDRVSLQIAHDRMDGSLPTTVSEADLMRRYGVSRAMIQRILGKLSEVGLVERKPGHGWVFQPTLQDQSARAESYRFRLLIEPAALLEPGFRLDAAWIAEMRDRHEEMLLARWDETRAITLFEINAAFHEGLAAASGNRYFATAIQQQNRLRRFSQYNWIHGHERVVVSCSEHLEILDRLESGDREVAVALLRRHLQRASALMRPPWLVAGD